VARHPNTRSHRCVFGGAVLNGRNRSNVPIFLGCGRLVGLAIYAVSAPRLPVYGGCVGDGLDEIVLRSVAPADVEAIAAYHHRCWLLSFAQLLEPGVVAAMDPTGKVDRFRGWFSDESDLSTIVAYDAGTPVGHVTVEGALVVHLFIDPDHQGRGLGRLLLGRGEDLIRVGGHGSAELHTIVGNRPAIALYESAGWVVTDRFVHNEHDGVRYDEHVLVKRFA
jgi:GNAT superfamily N-acetyltransferase